MCHNAGQYVGITSDNSANLEMASLEYGNGSLINPNDGSVNLDMARYYHALYGEAWVDLCERSLVRMKLRKDVLTGNGSLIGISSPGCNMMQNVNKGYSMPGTGTLFLFGVFFFCECVCVCDIAVWLFVALPLVSHITMVTLTIHLHHLYNIINRKIAHGIFHAHLCRQRGRLWC